jgi:hypothetical protein
MSNTRSDTGQNEAETNATVRSANWPILASIAKTTASSAKSSLTSDQSPQVVVSEEDQQRRDTRRSLIVIIVTVYRVDRTQSHGRSRNNSQ